MSTETYLVAHPQKEVFEIGGSWMHSFPETALLTRTMLRGEIRSRVPAHIADTYVDWLCDKMWRMVIAAQWDVCIVLEGAHDQFIEQGYKRVGSYFPLRNTAVIQ